MAHAFARIAFTPSVRAAQTAEGSRDGYARAFERDTRLRNATLGDDERAFLQRQRSVFLATVSETGWPYVQHRGGPEGFLRVLDDRHVAMADYAGNRQMISVGNLAANDRVALIAVDYARKQRLKLLARGRFVPLEPDTALWHRLVDPAYAARPQRALMLEVVAYDWNCPQHLPDLVPAAA